MNTERRAFNVIEEPTIRVELTSGAGERLTLPQVLAALAANRVESWPALRPHQAPAWHAFLVQVAAMGLEAVGRPGPPGNDDAAWAEVLRALTPDWPADEPWCLVTPPQCPALLQAPVPETDLREYERTFKNRVLAPGAPKYAGSRRSRRDWRTPRSRAEIMRPCGAWRRRHLPAMPRSPPSGCSGR